MPLYHFSEEPDIEVFEPRSPAHRPEAEPLVWAIDEWHARLRGPRAAGAGPDERIVRASWVERPEPRPLP